MNDNIDNEENVFENDDNIKSYSLNSSNLENEDVEYKDEDVENIEQIENSVEADNTFEAENSVETDNTFQAENSVPVENIAKEENSDSTYVQTSEQIVDNTIYTVENRTQPINNTINQPVEQTKKKSNVALCVGLVLGAALIIGAATLGTKYLVQKKNSEKIKITATPSETAKENDSEEQSNKEKVTATTTNNGSTVADIVDNVMPSIVSIACTVSQEYSFFGRSYSEDAEGSGSGIIIGQNEKQVYIATNNHVIDGANTVIITFNDEEDVEAEIKGTDSSNDLAVVAVNISDMKESTRKAIKVASLGKSENCKVGEMAVAIGNALGYGQSVTVGVISALNREISSEDYTMSLIQTDAAINPGNSGGALLNSKGEVIGINSVKYVSEDTEGMGYAIPITEAIEILNDLMNYEEIPENERAYLGIIGYDIDETFSQRSNIPEGIYIQEISKDAPASKSGLLVGDVIVKFAGKKVTTMEGVQNIMKNKKSGDKAEVVVMRAMDGQYKEKTITVTFGARGDYVK